MKGLYPGSFDPITIGHLDMIERASRICDELVIVIMQNPTKSYAFTENERKELIEKCISHLPNVSVEIGSGLTIDYAKKHDCNAIIRGIRAIADYEYELSMATSNMKLNPSIETILLVAKPEYSFLSSSIAKEVAHYGGDLSSFVPEIIAEDIEKRLGK